MSTNKKASSGRNSSYDNSSGDQGRKEKCFPSSSRDALNKEDGTRRSQPESRIHRNSSTRDAPTGKDAQHRYQTRSTRTKTALSAPRPAYAASAATGPATSPRDGCVMSEEFQLADDLHIAPPECGLEAGSSQDTTQNQPTVRSAARSVPDNEESSDEYNFSAVDETPPRDICLARDCFNPALNETAQEYALRRERRRLRDIEMDLLMGTLGAANQDEVISVSDIKEFTENRISEFGITCITYSTTNSEVKVSTDGDVPQMHSFSLDDLPSKDETVIFNGNISPYPTPREGQETYLLSSGSLPKDSCALCASNDSLYQFKSRYRKENLKHLLTHGRDSRDSESNDAQNESCDVYETVFSADATIICNDYNRQYNFLPAASTMREAVDIISLDDHIPFSHWMDDFEIIQSGIQCISRLPLSMLLKFYYCIVNSTYDVRGSAIRHVQVCRGYVPAP